MTNSNASPALTAEAVPEQLRGVVSAARDKKALNVVVLILQKPNAFTDYFLVCSARNTRQVRAIVDEVEKQQRAARKKPSHIEGYDHGEWVLMDFFDFVVHVFTLETRQLYDLERLWGNAMRIEFSDSNLTDP